MNWQRIGWLAIAIGVLTAAGCGVAQRTAASAPTTRNATERAGVRWTLLGGYMDEAGQCNVALQSAGVLRFVVTDASGRIRQDVSHRLPDYPFYSGYITVMYEGKLAVICRDDTRLQLLHLVDDKIEERNLVPEVPGIKGFNSFWFCGVAPGWRAVFLSRSPPSDVAAADALFGGCGKWLYTYMATDVGLRLAGVSPVDTAAVKGIDTHCGQAGREIAVWQILSGPRVELGSATTEPDSLVNGLGLEILRVGKIDKDGGIKWKYLYQVSHFAHLYFDSTDASACAMTEWLDLESGWYALWLVYMDGQRTLLGPHSSEYGGVSICLTDSGQAFVAHSTPEGIEVIHVGSSRTITAKRTIRVQRGSPHRMISGKGGTWLVSVEGGECRFDKISW